MSCKAARFDSGLFGGIESLEFQALWNQFLSTINRFPKLVADLNPGCSESEISEAEKTMGVTFPDDLKTLYLMNNGQGDSNQGIFKAVSGYSKHTKPAFLNWKRAVSVWRILRELQLDVFNESLIPFAASYDHSSLDDVYCINTNTQEVFLLWIYTCDWTLPVDWQTAKLKRGSNLQEFILCQINLY